MNRRELLLGGAGMAGLLLACGKAVEPTPVPTRRPENTPTPRPLSPEAYQTQVLTFKRNILRDVPDTKDLDSFREMIEKYYDQALDPSLRPLLDSLRDPESSVVKKNLRYSLSQGPYHGQDFQTGEKTHYFQHFDLFNPNFTNSGLTGIGDIYLVRISDNQGNLVLDSFGYRIDHNSRLMEDGYSNPARFKSSADLANAASRALRLPPEYLDEDPAPGYLSLVGNDFSDGLRVRYRISDLGEINVMRGDLGK